MKKLLPSILVAALAIAMAFTAVKGVEDVTAYISQVNNPLWAAAATLAELFGGTIWLLGTVFFATRSAVIIYRQSEQNGKRGL
jgi:hypothetical protein